MTKNWQSISERLVAALKPYGAPIGISFLSDSGDSPFDRRDDPYPEPNEHGRTGQVRPGACSGCGLSTHRLLPRHLIMPIAPWVV